MIFAVSKVDPLPDSGLTRRVKHPHRTSRHLRRAVVVHRVHVIARQPTATGYQLTT